MPKFIYTAKSHPTKTISGYIEAESEQDAINKLTQSGCFPISLKPEEASLDRRGSLRFRSISKKEVAMFTSQLFNLVESGVNIINTLNIIYNQAANKYLKNVLGSIVDKIKDGKSLSESLAAFPHIFSNLYSAMISVGEASGNLKSVLKQLSAYLEEDEEFKSSLRASLVYPLFIFSVGALTVFILLVFVIPRLVAMFDDMGQVLPLPTRIIISVSTFLRNYWWLLFAIVAVGVFLLKRAYSHPQGKLYWDRFKLKIIILGSVILKAQTSRLMRTLSLLISSGIPITPALDISASILENEILKSEVKRVKDSMSIEVCLISR